MTAQEEDKKLTIRALEFSLVEKVVGWAFIAYFGWLGYTVQTIAMEQARATTKIETLEKSNDGRYSAVDAAADRRNYDERFRLLTERVTKLEDKVD